ncbi:acid protease [Cenococcum geophilum]
MCCSIWLFFSCAIYSDIASATPNCTFEPVSLPIQDVRVSSVGVMRGIALSVGSPPQELSFLPIWPLNNTWIFDSLNGSCPRTTTNIACETKRGGYFVESNSTTYQNFSDVVLAGGAPSDNRTITGFGGTDGLVLNSSVSLAKFPFGIPRVVWPSPYHTQHAIGLGINSTILNALQSASQIGSRVWSMFWGLTGVSAPVQMDGIFVFGGYDKAKVQGKNHTQALGSFDRCDTGMLVTLSDMQLNFPNGTTETLLGSGFLSACIVPDFPNLITMPLDPYYSSFEALTQTANVGRSYGLNFFGMLYNTSSVYQGDITFTLNSGVTIRVPNSQFVLPDRDTNLDGRPFANTSISEVLINPTQDADSKDLPLLGRQFLTSAYVMLDQDANTFTIWQANPTTNIDLVPIVSDSILSACNSSIPASTSSTSSPAPINHSELKAGAIAGIAIGAVFAVGALGFAIFYWRRRRVKYSGANNFPPQPDYSSKPPHTFPLGEISGSQVPEFEGSSKLFHEMTADQAIESPPPPPPPRSDSPRTPRGGHLFELG